MTDKGNISDGYHTFDELYEHRNLLWINLCICNYTDCGIVKEHLYPGWFLLFMDTDKGQISYHLPNKLLPLVEGKIAEAIDYRYDGHTTNDVIDRLKSMSERS
jgi:hypothetical protein